RIASALGSLRKFLTASSNGHANYTGCQGIREAISQARRCKGNVFPAAFPTNAHERFRGTTRLHSEKCGAPAISSAAPSANANLHPSSSRRARTPSQLSRSQIGPQIQRLSFH